MPYDQSRGLIFRIVGSFDYFRYATLSGLLIGFRGGVPREASPTILIFVTWLTAIPTEIILPPSILFGLRELTVGAEGKRRPGLIIGRSCRRGSGLIVVGRGLPIT